MNNFYYYLTNNLHKRKANKRKANKRKANKRKANKQIKMTSSSDMKSNDRESVIHSYNSAVADNRRAYGKKDDKATAEYIFSNQMEDANNIVQMFYTKKCRAVSVPKVTKVGADGLMIALATLLTTHSDDDFVVDPDNVRIITGMSNASWSKDMITKAPSCFKDKIFHHGKLSKSDLSNLKNALIIIDEVDTGTKENQVLHKTLEKAGVLNVEYMETHNIRFVLISATMIKEYYDLYRWGELHEVYKMTIPDLYIGHRDFLEKGILKEFYDLKTKENAEKWVKEDIIDNYDETDFRVHIVRLYGKSVEIENACTRHGVVFMNNNSSNRLSPALEKMLFKDPLTSHIVLGVKGFYRRANLIPNSWKIRIGATHELYTEKVDNNVQIQGLPGRMTGYWRTIIESGHKTGPYRTSIKAIKEYLETYDNPLGLTSYKTNGFTKDKDGKVSAQPTMLSSHNIANLEPIDLPSMCIKGQMPIVVFTITNEEKCKFKQSAILEVIRKYDEETYVKYSTYHIHCWTMNTANKVSKWGLNSMLKPGALSTTTNLTSEERAKQVLMIYLYENKLLLSPWDGAS